MEKNICYPVGIMTFIRISNRLAVFGKWAELIRPLPVPDPLSAFHNFAQYILSKERVQYANPTLLKPNFLLMRL